MYKYDEIINFYFGKATNFRMDIVTKVEILYSFWTDLFLLSFWLKIQLKSIFSFF